jgi:hypothetical protein
LSPSLSVTLPGTLTSHVPSAPITVLLLLPFGHVTVVLLPGAPVPPIFVSPGAIGLTPGAIGAFFASAADTELLLLADADADSLLLAESEFDSLSDLR